MSCDYIAISDAVGNEPVEGEPRYVIVTGTLHRDCDTEKVYVWLGDQDGQHTARVEAVFGISSTGGRTGIWSATINALFDPDDEEKIPFVECLENKVVVYAECEDANGRILCSDEITLKRLWCCPWEVLVNVYRSDGFNIGGDHSVYRGLEPGRYVVTVTEPPEPSDGEPAMTYNWYVNGRLQRDSEREFSYELQEDSVNIKVSVRQNGCEAIDKEVTLEIKMPFKCPDVMKIIKKSISAKCKDGKALVTLECIIEGAEEGMRLEMNCGDESTTEELEIRREDIQDDGTARITVQRRFIAPGTYQVELYVLDPDGGRAAICTGADYELRLKPCLAPAPDDGGGDSGRPGEDEDGDEDVDEDIPVNRNGSFCWLALLFFSIGLVAVFGFLAFSPCVPPLLIGSVSALS